MDHGLAAPASPVRAEPAAGPVAPEPLGGSCSRKAVLVASLVLAVIYLLSPNVLPRGDAALSVPTAASLVHHHDLDLTEYEDVPWVRDDNALVHYEGRDVDYFPWLGAVAAIPAVVAVD